MAKIFKAKVFVSAGSQAILIPDEFRFLAAEVFVRRDPERGDLVLSEMPSGWDEIYAALDRAGIPDDFLTKR